MKKVSFALAMMAVLGFGTLLVERASAQNTNSSTTMTNTSKPSMSRRHGRHRRGRRHGRWARRRRMGMSKPKNANQ